MSERGRSNDHPARGNSGRGGRGEQNAMKSTRGGSQRHDFKKSGPEGKSVDKIHFGTDLVELSKRLTNLASKQWPILVEVFTDEVYVFNDMPRRDDIERTMQAVEDRDLIRSTVQPRRL